MYEWRPFLEQWSRTILASPEADFLGLPERVARSGWLGFDPATDAQIRAAETRLDAAFPPSYREFLRVSNGWRHTGLSIARILPVEQIDWFGRRHPDWAAHWTPPHAGAEAPNGANYAQLPRTLAISDVGDDAILLLNPAAPTSGGEWEAWLFADWNPGAVRYASFWSLLQSQDAGLQAVARVAEGQVQPFDPPDAVVTKLPMLIAALEERLHDYAPLAENPAPGQHGRYAGQIEGLDHVVQEVRAIQAQTADPHAVRVELLALADRLDGAAEALDSAVRGGVDVQGMLRALGGAGRLLTSKGRMSDAVRRSARARGLRHGAGVIRWYLGVE